MKLHVKIFLIFFAIILLSFLIVFIHLDRTFYNDYLSRTKISIKSQVVSIKETLPKIKHDKTSIRDLSRRFGEAFGSRVSIIDGKGVVIADSFMPDEDLHKMDNHINRQEIQSALESGEGLSKRFSTTIKKDILYYAERVDTKHFSGFIRVAIPLDNLSTISRDYVKSITIFLIVVVISSLFVALIAFYLISRPIRTLAEDARKIASGDFSRSIITESRDEVGQLSKSLNKMKEDIGKRIEEIVANNSRFEAVLLSMSNGVMVLDTSGTIRLMNDSLKEILGISSESPIGKKPVEIIRNNEIQEISERVIKMDKGSLINREEFIVSSNKTVLIHAAPFFNRNELLGAVVVFSDVTELRRLERIRKDFVANVSHELRTPISNIIGYSETLLDGAISDKKNAATFLNIIESEAKRLSLIINDVLDLSKIESDNFNIKIQQGVNLRKLSSSAIKNLKKKAESKSIVVSNEIPGNIEADVDPNLIEQVFINLIDNAIKYSNNNTSIKLFSKTQNKSVSVSVSDQGIGIPEADTDRIFERFYRVDKSRSKDSGGTGLGLSIVKHIVQIHGGNVSVESDYGRGSTFSFTIPVN